MVFDRYTDPVVRDNILRNRNRALSLSTYDTTGSGVVDNSELLNGELPSYYLDWNNFTNTPTTLSGYGITDSFDGQFVSLTNKPTTLFGYGITDAFSGKWEDIIGLPTFSTIAYTGSYNNLLDVPTLALVATTGDYNDLLNKPTGSGIIVDHSDLTNLDYSNSGHTGFASSSHTHTGDYINDPGTSVDREILTWSSTTGESVRVNTGVSIDVNESVIAGGDVVAYSTGGGGTPLSSDNFKTWHIGTGSYSWGTSDVIAGPDDVMDIVAGTGITLETDAATKAIKITGTTAMTYPTAGIPISTGSAWVNPSITPSTGWLYYSGSAYSWSAPTLNDIGNPTGDKLFTMTSRQLSFTWTNPVPTDGAMELSVTGNFTGDVLHVHQHTGVPGAGSHGIHITTEHANIIPLYISGSSGLVMELRNPAGTYSYKLYTGAITTADRSLTLPAITGSDTLATIGLAQTFSANQTFSAIVALAAYGAGTTGWSIGGTQVITNATRLNYLQSAGGTSGTTSTNIVFSTSPALTTPTVVTSIVGGATFAAFNTTTTNLSFGGAATTMTIGGTPTTAITHSYSANATATATTKTVNFATGGAAGSTTNVNIGSTAGGTLTINNPIITFGSTTTNINGAIIFNDFTQTFRDDKLRIQNPAETAYYTITAAAIAADRVLMLPLTTGTDTLVSLALAQTFTAAKTFNNQMLKLRNPADTFSYIINTSAIITADKNLTIPLITADDTFATLGMTQTFTGTNTFSTITSSNGTFNSSVADSGTAVGFTLSTPAYSTNGAKLLVVKNNTDARLTVTKDGQLESYGDVVAYSSGGGGTPLTADTFKTWHISVGSYTYDDADLVAGANDTVNFVAGTGITINTASSGKAIKITNSGATASHASTHITGGGDTIANFSTSSTTAGLVPGSNGNTTYFLKGDGTWAAASGSSQWTTSGSDIYYGTGNVDIKTGKKLRLYNPADNAYAELSMDASNDLIIKNGNDHIYYQGLTDHYFQTYYSSAWTTRVKFFNDGKIQFGDQTTSAYARVQAISTDQVTSPTLGNPAGVGLAVSSGANTAYGITMGTASTGRGWIQAMRLDGTATGYDLILQPSGGNVGIGVSPSTRLHVYGGTLRVENGTNIGAIQLGQGDGVLGHTSNTGYWEEWDGVDYFRGFAIYGSTHIVALCPTEGNVGIGTTSPGGAKLKVHSGSLWLTGLTANDANEAGMGFFGGDNGGGIYARGSAGAGTFSLSNASYTWFYGNATGNVGIGTTSPDKRFHVDGADTSDGIIISSGGETSYGRLWFKGGTGTAGVINRVTSTDTLYFGEDADTGNYVFRGGKVGIGTTTITNDKVLVDSNMGSASNTGFRVIYSGGTTTLGEAAFLAHRNSVWSNLYLSGTGSSTSYGLYVDGTKPNYFAGSVGFGSTSIIGKVEIKTSTGSEVMLALGDSSNATYPGYLYFSNTNLFNSGYSVASDGAGLYLNYLGYNNGTSYYRNTHIANGRGTEVLSVIGSTGRVGINNTAPAEALHVGNSTKTSNTWMRADAAAAYQKGVVLCTGGVSKWHMYMESNDDTLLRFYDDAGLHMSLSNAGNLNVTGEITAYSSDIRFKTNIEPIKNAVYKVTKLSGFTYTANELAIELTGNTDISRKVGISAQALQEVLPEAVRLAPFDDNKGKSKSGENYLTVQYEKIVPLLIEAIKELKQEIEDLKHGIK